jgi:hypothetical protein
VTAPATAFDVEFVTQMMADAATPEEWVARYGHALWMWSAPGRAFADPEQAAWVRDVAALMRDPGPAELRQRLLSAAECAAIEAEIAAELDE